MPFEEGCRSFALESSVTEGPAVAKQFQISESLTVLLKQTSHEEFEYIHPVLPMCERCIRSRRP